MTPSKMSISYNSKGTSSFDTFRAHLMEKRFIYVEPAYVFKWRTVKKDSTPLRSAKILRYFLAHFTTAGTKKVFFIC